MSGFGDILAMAGGVGDFANGEVQRNFQAEEKAKDAQRQVDLVKLQNELQIARDRTAAALAREYAGYARQDELTFKSDNAEKLNKLDYDKRVSEAKAALDPTVTAAKTTAKNAEALNDLEFADKNKGLISANLKMQANGKESDAETNLKNAQALYYGLHGQALKAAQERTQKMPEEDKLRFQESGKMLLEADKGVANALLEATKAGAENPETAPAVKYAKERLAAAQKQHTALGIELGTVKPGDMATQILGVAKTKQEVFARGKQITDAFGDFGEQVMAAASASDKFKSLPDGDTKLKGYGDPEQTPATPGKKGGRPITFQEQEFANKVAKDGWQYYTNDYGTWGDTAYRRRTPDGGWEVVKRDDLARKLGIEF